MIRSADDLPQLEGLTRSEIRDYGPPELGWSVLYTTAEGLTATVYVYPWRNLGPGPTDAGAIAADEFARAAEGIRAADFYREVVALKRSPARLEPSSIDPEALHQSFLLRTDHGSQFSELVLIVSDGQYVKIRGTYPPYPPVHEREHGRAMDRLLVAIAQTLVNRPAP